MHFPKRLYGTENEFGVVAQYPDGHLTDAMSYEIGTSIRVELIPHSVAALDAYSQKSRIWHSNGGCTYVDTGDHPEYATPECASIRDVVRYNKAGEYIASAVFDQPNDVGLRFLLFKNNLGYNANYNPDYFYPGNLSISGQFGCHENYLIPAYYLRTPELFKPIIPFLATRQIFDGAGWWERDDTFHLSQRAFAIMQELGTSAATNRAFFTIRSGDTGPDARLHVICGDANICEFALYLKLGTMALALALLESGCCPRFICENPVDALHTISRSADPFLPYVQIEHYGSMSAFDIQTAFLQAVQREIPSAAYASERIEAEVKDIAHKWEQTLNAIYNRDDEWMRGRIDHVTKWYAAALHLKRMVRNTAQSPSAHRKELDILYHEISDRRFQNWIYAKWPERRILTDDEITQARLSAPQDTRARMRGMFIEALVANGITYSSHLDWRICGFPDNSTEHSFALPDGLVSDVDGFDAFLASIPDKKIS